MANANYYINYVSENYNNIILNHLSFNWVYLSFILFFIAIHGIFLGRKNIIIVLMSIEVMLISIMILFIFYSLLLDDIFGQLFTLFILTVGASESAIGLSLIVAYYRSYYLY